jgi:hypothetical protein
MTTIAGSPALADAFVSKDGSDLAVPSHYFKIFIREIGGELTRRPSESCRRSRRSSRQRTRGGAR